MILEIITGSKEAHKRKKEGFYVWEHKHIGFQGGSSPTWGETNENKKFFVFQTRQDFDKWFREVQIGLAELDEVMNYCAFFKRSKGNEGEYVREGKSFPVDGLWDGYYINADWSKAETEIQKYWMDKLAPFQEFLRQNGWFKNWFKLNEKYT